MIISDHNSQLCYNPSPSLSPTKFLGGRVQQKVSVSNLPDFNYLGLTGLVAAVVVVVVVMGVMVVVVMVVVVSCNGYNCGTSGGNMLLKHCGFG